MYILFKDEYKYDQRCVNVYLFTLVFCIFLRYFLCFVLEIRFENFVSGQWELIVLFFCCLYCWRSYKQSF